MNCVNQSLSYVLGVCLWITAAASFAVPADLDDDGIPNQVEIDAGLDPNNGADGALDLDEDGWSNVDEYRFGTQIGNVYSNPSTVHDAKHQ